MTQKTKLKNLKNLRIGYCNMEGGLSANLAKTTEIKDIIFRDKLDLFGINSLAQQDVVSRFDFF